MKLINFVQPSPCNNCLYKYGWLIVITGSLVGMAGLWSSLYLRKRQKLLEQQDRLQQIEEEVAILQQHHQKYKELCACKESLENFVRSISKQKNKDCGALFQSIDKVVAEFGECRELAVGNGIVSCVIVCPTLEKLSLITRTCVSATGKEVVVHNFSVNEGSVVARFSVANE